MHAVAVVGGGRAIGGGSDERVRELDAPPDLEQTRVHRGTGRRRVEPEGLGGAMEQHGVAERLRGGRQDEQPGVGGQLEEAPGVALLDLAGRRLVAGETEPAGEVRDVPGAGQLEEREGVATALRDDLVADRGVQRAAHVVQQKRARVGVAEPWRGSSGSPARTSSPTPVRAAHTIAIRSARSRRATKARICREAWSSHCASSTRQTSGCCSAISARSVSVASPTMNRSGAGAGAPAEHGGEGVALRGRESVQVIEHGGAELVDAAVGQLDLRLDTDGPRNAPAADTDGQVAQQRALSHARLPAQDGDPAPTGERIGQEPVERLALGMASEEPRRAHTGLSGQTRLPDVSTRSASATYQRPGSR